MYAALEDFDLLFVSYLHYLLTWLGNRNLSRGYASCSRGARGDRALGRPRLLAVPYSGEP